MLKNFFLGLGDVGRGFSFTRDNKSILKFLIPPLLINFILFAVLVFFIVQYYGDLFTALSSQLGGLSIQSDAWWSSIVSGLFWLVRGILHFLLGALLLALTVIVMLLLSQIINSPFYDLISEAVERKKTGLGDEFINWKKLFTDILKTIGIELKKLMLFLFVPLLLLVLNIIPVVGALLYTVLANFFAGWDMGFNYAAFSMGRKVIPFKEQLNFALSNKMRLFGFGLPLLIPFFNILFAPIFVVGGTLMYLELKGPGVKTAPVVRV